ncbi:Leucine-rich repeat neuronal protein 1 [Aphelenchoides bicaudatus]|nr:Leucine-rich repeat neuronal protein 1 [Aphelenchoides bicaudatus]
MRYKTLLIFTTVVLVFGNARASCPRECECNGKQALYCHNLSNATVHSLFTNQTFIDEYTDKLLNLTLHNCSISSVDFLPISVLRNLLYLDLSFNELADFKFPTPSHFMQVYLDQNRIFSIDWEAFRLYKLKRLWLMRNNLLAINEHILRFTPNLEFLDLSHNQLASAQSSSFFTARRLTELNLSHNRLQRFDYDSFLPLHQLQILDFSYNNFTEVPAGLAQFVGLRQLNFSANPIDRIRSGDFRLPVLQLIVLEYCDLLSLVESHSFVEMPNIQTVVIRNNPKLKFVSPNAFVNNNVIYEIDLTNNSLPVAQFNSTSPSRILISGNPLECECMLQMIAEMDKHIIDADRVECKIKKENVDKLISLKEFQSRYSAQECSIQPLMPMGTNNEVKVGSKMSLYCAPRLLNDSLTWEDKKKGQRIANQFEIKPTNSRQLSIIHAISMQPFDVLQIAHHERIQQVDEQLVIQTVVAEDAGSYVCKVQRNEQKFEQPFQLKVKRPEIQLYSIDIGSHYVALGWNQSLNVEWTENVRLMMAVRDEYNSTMRVIQLNILNPWFGYNVLRLKPEKNYTFCLYYEFIFNYANEIYETCTIAQTLPSLSFWASLHPSTVFLLLGFSILFTVLMCFRGFYIRFYIWHQAKARSRMNQSISGQSFLSRSTTSNANDSIMSNSSNIRQCRGGSNVHNFGGNDSNN